MQTRATHVVDLLERMAPMKKWDDLVRNVTVEAKVDGKKETGKVVVVKMDREGNPVAVVASLDSQKGRKGYINTTIPIKDVIRVT
jgi:hypothetical protein